MALNLPQVGMKYENKKNIWNHHLALVNTQAAPTDPYLGKVFQ